ncbi:MAG: aldo/keto reductase [Anaerolineae bacterium]|nr:aldo/keto reductase [Anaerolineae bacterium]
MRYTIKDTVTLHNGVEMPRFGLGVYQTREGQEIENAVRWALEAGYRSIDTAAFYGNEAGVGKAVRESGIPREEIFITTKVWNIDQGYDKTLAAFETSLKKLAMDYIDLYLIHWPVRGMYPKTWNALETIYKSGKARAIGVSNFLNYHLEALANTAHIVPMVNQVEFHPYLQQVELQAYCQEHNIQVEGWRPIMGGKVLDIPELVAIGEKYNKSAVHVTLRWMLQLGVVMIPKSSQKRRIQDNANIFDFELSAEDMEIINSLDRDHRTGPHPDTF